jgi:hypothetical protein
MKNITPITIWKDGQSKTASVLNARIINDDLKSSSVFYWELKEADQVIPADPEVEGSTETTINGQVLANGNCTMSGEEYDAWDGSNDTAYTFVAGQINVVIVAE